MKGNVLFLSVAALAALTGCSTKSEPAAESITVNPVQQERCYSMDNVSQETAGRAYLAEGRQFYFHVDCEKHLALQDVAEAMAVKDEAKLTSDTQSAEGAGSAVNPGDPNALKAATGPGLPAGGSQAEGSEASAEPKCYSDKMTAGRGDLPPCEWDEEKQEYIKK